MATAVVSRARRLRCMRVFLLYATYRGGAECYPARAAPVDGRPPAPWVIRSSMMPSSTIDDAGGQALAEVLALGEPGDDVEAERAGTDERADDDHREDHDDALVRREQQRPPGQGQLDLPEQLALRRPGRPRGLDDGRRDGADARVDEPDDRRDGVDHGRDDGREAADREQGDGRDQVDEGGQRLGRVQERPDRSSGTGRCARTGSRSPTPRIRVSGRGDEDARQRLHAVLPEAEGRGQEQAHAGDDRRAQAARCTRRRRTRRRRPAATAPS